MTPELAELLARYGAQMEGPPSKKMERAEAFERAVRLVAEKHGLDRANLAAFVVRQWYLTTQKEDQRQGQGKRAEN